MNIDLKGKVAVVSGGATLIGKAVVQALVSAGAHVAILDINAKGKAIAESFNHDVMFIQTDLTSDAAIQQAVADIHQHLGEVSYLANLACTYLDDGFKSSRQDWLQALDINLVSTVELSRALYHDLKNSKVQSLILLQSRPKWHKQGAGYIQCLKPRYVNSHKAWQWILLAMVFASTQFHRVGHGLVSLQKSVAITVKKPIAWQPIITC